MLINLFKKVPAGGMIVPLLVAAIINTFLPSLYQLGPISNSIASMEGMNTIIWISLMSVGSQLTFKRLKFAFQRGGALLISKWISGLILGFIMIKLFGHDGILGVTSLAVITALTVQSNSLFIGLMNEYGDDIDIASAAFTALISVPIFTFFTLKILGVADITATSIMDLLSPLLIGMFLGNADKGISNFLLNTQNYTIPFMGFSIGANINLFSIVEGGISGLFLTFITIISSLIFILPADRIINKRPGYAAWALATTAGNAMIVPMLVAEIDIGWASYGESIAAQLGTVVILTAIITPFITDLRSRKFGAPKYQKTNDPHGV